MNKTQKLEKELKVKEKEIKKDEEDIEKGEEETGIDLDHDGEKGESKEHKEKIKKAKLKKFKEWLELKEDDDAVLGGRLGQQSSVGRSFQSRSSQPLGQMNDQNRLPLIAQFILNIYNKLPVNQRLDTFNREFSYLKQKVVSSMMDAQSQQQGNV